MVSEISFVWIIPFLALAIAASVWFYRNVSWLSAQSRTIRWIMIGMRALVLFIALILLVGIILETVGYREEKPVVITLVDNSSSLRNYRDSNSVRSRISEFRAALKDKFADRFEIVEMTTGATANYSSDITLEESRSNISAGFEKIRNDFYNRNVGGVVLISDGNFNEGPNPVYVAEKITLTPVFSLLVGDTVRKKDQFIKNIAVNDVAFLKNEFPVEVDLESYKFGNKEVTVSITRDGKTVAEKRVKYSGNAVDFQNVQFKLNADKVGFNTYQVIVSDAENEYNYRNNKRSFYIEVIDSRSRVLLLAGAPHPDVSAIRQEFETDQNLQVESFIMKDWNKDLKNVDLIVLHEPGLNMDEATLNLIITRKIPVLFVIGPNASSAQVRDLGIGVTIPVSRQTDENQSYINVGFSQFEVSNDLKKAMEYYPPLKSRFGEIKAAGAEILSFQRIGNVQKKDPSIFFVRKNGVKYGLINGEGIWKWRMNEFARTGEVKGFRELISKIGQYLLVKQNNSSLRVEIPKRVTKNEEAIVNASFYNESLEPILTASIDLELTDEKGKKKKFTFGVVGNMYRLSLGKLEPGRYSWRCVAVHQGKKHRKSGDFIVEDIDPELLVSSSDKSVLDQLAVTTNGKVFQLEKYQSLLGELEKRGDITTMSFKESSFDGLIDFKFLFFLLLILLVGEWFLRRWLGAY